jgi:hypothetical protein
MFSKQQNMIDSKLVLNRMFGLWVKWVSFNNCK